MDVPEQALSAFEWREAPDADLAVIGDPVSHSLSPIMHAAAFAACNLNARYVAIRVPQGEVAQAVAYLTARGYRGLNVTVPLKEEAARLPLLLSDFAQAVGAVNTIDLGAQTATNTDGPALLELLPENSSVLLLGSGGTARAFAFALRSWPARVAVWNRTSAKAQQLAQTAGIEAIEQPLASGFDVVVNATSATLHGDELPLTWEGHGLAIEAMYGTSSLFLEQAERAGWQTMDGIPLLVAQGALAFEYWWRLPAPRQAMLEAVTMGIEEGN